MPPRAGGAGSARQASLRRLHDFQVRPNRELGQNFLIDDNLLGVIGAAAELSGEDVVLEVGGGLGTLSEYLAPRVSHLHVVELDRALAAPLEDALAPFDNATRHMADAVRLDLEALAPAPTKVVANLPYGVAATVVIRTVRELPTTGLWVAMVQREVAARLAAPPGSRTYGASSAIVQLACDVRVVRRVGRSVFHPTPKVDSALVRLRRTRPPPDAETVALIHAAFAHRRKTLAGSLGIDRASPPGTREVAADALERLGLRRDARAERLSPGDFAALARELGSAWPSPVARR